MSAIELVRGGQAAADGGVSPADLAALEGLTEALFAGSGMRIADELSRGWTRLWVAREGGGVVGYLLGWHVADELHVLLVATAPARRREGVGRALVEAALAYASTERIRLAVLEVRRGNAAAIGLYRALGFTFLSLRRAYYDDGEDAVEMLRALDPLTGALVPTLDELVIDGAPGLK